MRVFIGIERASWVLRIVLDYCLLIAVRARAALVMLETLLRPIRSPSTALFF
jgi:hypothetical protein